MVAASKPWGRMCNQRIYVDVYLSADGGDARHMLFVMWPSMPLFDDWLHVLHGGV